MSASAFPDIKIMNVKNRNKMDFKVIASMNN